MVTVPIFRSRYRFSLAANVGAVVMPWMIFYQQGAVIDKQWTTRLLKTARWDTGIGAVMTQAIMIAMVITAAATLRSHHITSLQSVSQISRGLSAVLGGVVGKLTWGAGHFGGRLCRRAGSVVGGSLGY